MFVLEVRRRRERDFGPSSDSASGTNCFMTDYENDLECDSLCTESYDESNEDDQLCCDLAASKTPEGDHVREDSEDLAGK